MLLNGAVSCVGKNYNGMLGIGEASETFVATRRKQVFSAGVIDLACTKESACCVVKSNEELHCWGSGTNYQTGLGTTSHKYSPEKVGDGYDMIRCGYNSCLARKTSDKSLYGWGGNGARMIGAGGSARSTPTNDLSITDVKDYTMMKAGVVAVKTGGTVYGWGYQSYTEHPAQYPNYYETPTTYAAAHKMNDCDSFFISGFGDQKLGVCKDTSGKAISFGDTSVLVLYGANTGSAPQYMTYTTTKDASGQSTSWSDVKEIAVNGNTVYILTTGGEIYFGGAASTGYTATESITWSPITSGVKLDAWGSDNDHIGVGGANGFIVIKNNSSEYCIGYNDDGQIGTGDQVTDTSYPYSIKEHNPPSLCAINEYGNNGVCTACATAYRNPAGDDQSCTTCSCTKLADCALNEYANGDGCTTCGTDALNTAGDDPATVTSCTCPENYYGNNGICTQCTGNDIEFTVKQSGIADQSLTRAQCQDYAENKAGTAWGGNVVLEGSYPKGCSVKYVIPFTAYWNPSVTSTISCGSLISCLEGNSFTATAGTRAAGDNQTCTTCSCDAPCQKNQYGNGTGCSACGANTQPRPMGDLQTCTNCTCQCPINYYGNNGACTACASAYRNTAGEDQSCTTCSCNKLPNCALNEYANGDGCTACGANAANIAGDDPATVTTCTCPLNYFGNSGLCTECKPTSVGFVEITDNSAPTVAATKTQCEHYATVTDGKTWQGDVSTAVQSWQPKGCIVVQLTNVFWNPSTTSLTSCDSTHKCIDITTNTHVGTKLAGDDQSCTTCSCDALCGIGNYGDNYGCSLCAANTQAKAAGDLQSCTTCTCLCTENHYGNNGSCTPCQNGYENAAGDSQLCTTCSCAAKPPCPVGQYGNGNGCTQCPANTMPKDSGDSQDCTVCSCQCQANHRGDNGVCTPCSTGYARDEGDNMNSNDLCDKCDANHFGNSGQCQQCPANTQAKTAGDSVQCANCHCTCKENFYGNFGTCTSCPSNSTNAAGDSHGCQNCTCACDENHYGVNNSCVACLYGFSNPSGDLPSCENCSCTPPPTLPPTTPSSASNIVFHKAAMLIAGITILMVI